MSGSLFSSDRFETLPKKPSRIGRVLVWLILFGIPVAVLIYLPHLTKPEPHPEETPPASPPAGQASAVTDPAAVPVYQLGTRLDFTKASADPYLAGGWYDREADLRWSGREGIVRFRLEKAQPLRLRMRVHTFHEQKIIVRLNEKEMGTLHGGGADFQELQLDLPTSWVDGVNTLTLTMADAKSPKDFGEPDNRLLGAGVAWMELAPPS
jgi:hypothetical protein